MFLHFSAKKVECAKHQWIHLVGDQPKSRASPIGESQDSPHNTTHMHYHYRIF